MSNAINILLNYALLMMGVNSAAARLIHLIREEHKEEIKKLKRKIKKKKNEIQMMKARLDVDDQIIARHINGPDEDEI